MSVRILGASVSGRSCHPPALSPFFQSALLRSLLELLKWLSWRLCVPARILGASTLPSGVRASSLAFWEMASVRARSHSESLSSSRLRPCEPGRILGAKVAFVRARSHSRRLNSPRRRPRAPAHILGDEATFVRARAHCRRMNSALSTIAES